MVSTLQNTGNTHLNFGSAGNRNNVFSLCENPCKGDLSCRSVVSISYGFEAINELEDVGEILLGVARHRASKIVFFEVIG